jgi:hypothetical protein
MFSTTAPYAVYHEDDRYQQELEMPLSLQDKLDLDADVDFFAAGVDDFESKTGGLKGLCWLPAGDESSDHRKRFRSEEFTNAGHQGNQGGPGSSQKPKILNYVCEVRRLLKWVIFI